MTDNQQKAHDLFFQTNLNQQQIADLVGVNRKTLYGWIKEGYWVRAKHAATYAPAILAEQYYAQLAALNSKIAERDEPFATKEEADIIRKLTITVNTIRNERQTCSETIELFTRFTDALMKKDKELAIKVTAHMDEYVKNLTTEGWIKNGRKYLRQERELDEEYQQWLMSHLPPFEPSPTPTPVGADPRVCPTQHGNDIVGADLTCIDDNITEPSTPASDETPLSAPRTPLSFNGVQNGVLPKPENTSKPATEANNEKNSNTRLSTNKKEKQGIAPPPMNRKERRLQQRMLKFKPNRSGRK